MPYLIVKLHYILFYFIFWHFVINDLQGPTENRSGEWAPWINIIIIRSKVFFLYIGREPTTGPANNCLQIMVCSCAMPSTEFGYK